MKFVLNKQSIDNVIERRLVAVDPAIRIAFPPVLKQPTIYWWSFGDDSLLALLFLTEADIHRVNNFTERHWSPFPALFTTSATESAAFRLEKFRFQVLQSCRVKGSNSFSVGADCTFVVVDHAVEVSTAEAGLVSYTVPLGYCVSFGVEITADNVYENLDQLIAYSVKTWAEQPQSK